MFNSFTIETDPNIFDELESIIEYEDVTYGRKGANIVDSKDGLIPIVRTTTIYNRPAQRFLPIHVDIVQKIKTVSGIDNLDVNNALVEIYDQRYRKMGFHTDQSLDLQPNSYICIFSCYENKDVPKEHLRRLVIQNKNDGPEREILLEHNSVVIFSTATNQQHRHKIIINPRSYNYANRWLGITFRLSKTFIKFIDGVPYFDLTGTVLKLANQYELKEFSALKGKENKETSFEYPVIEYTNSPSDLMPLSH